VILEDEWSWGGLTSLALAVSRSQKAFVNLPLEDNPYVLRRVLGFHKAKAKEILDRNNLSGVGALSITASIDSRQEHIELLVEAGADVSIAPDTGHTMLDLVYERSEDGWNKVCHCEKDCFDTAGRMHSKYSHER